MYNTTLIEDAPILTPNVSHQNFTETADYLEAGTEVNGDWKEINGLRRGKPFTYKVFITDNDEVIYSKYVKPMMTREITMGADSQVSATKIEMAGSERKTNIIRAVSSATGAVIGYAYAKKRGLSKNRTLLFAGVGALAGFIISRQFTKGTGIVVQKSK